MGVDLKSRIPVELQNEIVGNNVVLFIGAGFVKNYLEGMPTWTELLQKVFHQLTGKKDGIFDYCSVAFDANRKRIVPPGEHLRVAQQFELARETINAQRVAKKLPVIDGIHRLVQNEINSKYRKEEAVRATKGKHLLALKRLPFSVWVTTNYDTFLEDILFEEDSHRNAVIDRPVRNIDFKPSAGGRFLLKIHGSIKSVRPEASIVITEDDYHRFLRQDRYLLNKLYTLFCERTVIFLGYGLSDPNIQFIYNEVLFDQKRTEGDEGRSFSQVRPAYFVSRDKVSPTDKTYFLHKRINYIEQCPIEDFFSDAIKVFEGFKKSRLSIKDRIETSRDRYDMLFKDLNERKEGALCAEVALEQRARFISFIYDLIELHKFHYGAPIGESFRPYDRNPLVQAIHKGTRVYEVWIEEELAAGKVELFIANTKLMKEKLRDSSDWFAKHRLEKIGAWLCQFRDLHDSDKLSQDYCSQIFAYDQQFNTWDDCKFCLEQYVRVTPLFPVLDLQTKERVVEMLYKQLSRCGRDMGDSWYSTDRVYECWSAFNPEAWSYLEKVIVKKRVKIGRKVWIDPKDQAMLTHLKPGADPTGFLPRA